MSTVASTATLGKNAFSFLYNRVKNSPGEGKILAVGAVISQFTSSGIVDTALNMGGIASVFLPQLLPFMAAVFAVKGLYHLGRGFLSLGSDKGEAFSHFLNGGLSIAFALPFTSLLKNFNAIKTASSSAAPLAGKQLEQFTIKSIFENPKQAIETMAANLKRLKDQLRPEEDLLKSFNGKLNTVEGKMSGFVDRKQPLRPCIKPNQHGVIASRKAGVTDELVKDVESGLSATVKNAIKAQKVPQKLFDDAALAAKNAADDLAKDATNAALKQVAERAEKAKELANEALNKANQVIVKAKGKYDKFKTLATERSQIKSEIAAVNERISKFGIRTRYDEAVKVYNETTTAMKGNTLTPELGGELLARYNTTLHKVTIDPVKFVDQLAVKAYGADAREFQAAVTQPLMGQRPTVGSLADGAINRLFSGLQSAGDRWKAVRAARQVTSAPAASKIILQPGETLSKSGLIIVPAA